MCLIPACKTLCGIGFILDMRYPADISFPAFIKLLSSHIYIDACMSSYWKRMNNLQSPVSTSFPFSGRC